MAVLAAQCNLSFPNEGPLCLSVWSMKRSVLGRLPGDSTGQTSLPSSSLHLCRSNLRSEIHVHVPPSIWLLLKGFGFWSNFRPGFRKPQNDTDLEVQSEKTHNTGLEDS